MQRAAPSCASDATVRCALRQIAITELGHEEPTPLLANQLRRGEVRLVDPTRSRYGPSASTCTNLCGRRTTLPMATMAVSEAREKLADAVETARTEPVVLERYGRPVAVLVSPERYEKMLAALEDAEDVDAFDAAMAEEGPNVPWDQAKTDLG